ncbi:leucine-rich repeat protein [Waltera sp.]|uniref:leucine-rich repeat protein n=1 Tax=Waltera sp. TaxID=2815806 RepID=UPI0039A160B1
MSANTFANNCNLILVSLPASVQSVGDSAFKNGCHNLATVIFNNSSIAIGTDAFKTGTLPVHRTGCSAHSTATAMNDADNSPAVKLTFEEKSHRSPHRISMR